jgi:hypothetical protein
MGYGEMRNYYTVIGIPKVRRPFVISRRKMEWRSIKIKVLEIKK